MGLPIDGKVLVGLTGWGGRGGGGCWSTMCEELLGFQVPANDKILVGQRILINQLLQHIVDPLPDNVTKIQIHQYARCYILVLLGDTIFIAKLGDRMHLMFLEFLWNLHDPP